jgi:hypothetical protein
MKLLLIALILFKLNKKQTLRFVCVCHVSVLLIAIATMWFFLWDNDDICFVLCNHDELEFSDSFIVLQHWRSADTLFWFRGNPYSFLLVNDACLALHDK